MANFSEPGSSSQHGKPFLLKGNFIYPTYMKAQSIVVSDQILKIAFLKQIFRPCDLLNLYPTITVLTNLVGFHPRIIPVRVTQNPVSGFREDV